LSSIFHPTFLTKQLVASIEQGKVTVKGFNAKVVGILATLLVNSIALKDIKIVDQKNWYNSFPSFS